MRTDNSKLLVQFSVLEPTSAANSGSVQTITLTQNSSLSSPFTKRLQLPNVHKGRNPHGQGSTRELFRTLFFYLSSSLAPWVFFKVSPECTLLFQYQFLRNRWITLTHPSRTCPLQFEETQVVSAKWRKNNPGKPKLRMMLGSGRSINPPRGILGLMHVF